MTAVVDVERLWRALKSLLGERRMSLRDVNLDICACDMWPRVLLGLPPRDPGKHPAARGGVVRADRHGSAAASRCGERYHVQWCDNDVSQQREPFLHEGTADTFIDMKCWLVVLVVVMMAACGFPRPQDVVDDAPPNTPTEFGTFVKVAFETAADIPTTPLTWTNNVDLNTDGSTLCNTHNNQAARYCVVIGTSITLANGATLRAHGSKALVLLATSTIDLQGTVDVSSKHGELSTGAGAAAVSSCLNQRVATGNSGSFGGSFRGQGGDGGALDGEGGIAASALGDFPSDLRGGCPGGNGSSTTPGIMPAGGNGGGAVAIIAAEIHMNGKINASGAGGLGGPAVKSGGGGGGSGGMIVLDTRSIVPGKGPNIWLFASGGGGGQGGTGEGSGAGAGDDGQEPSSPLTNGAGGSNVNRSGGPGGYGSAGVHYNAGDADYAANSGGGGGGGGAAGFIRTPPIAGALLAPPSFVP